MIAPLLVVITLALLASLLILAGIYNAVRQESREEDR